MSDAALAFSPHGMPLTATLLAWNAILDNFSVDKFFQIVSVLGSTLTAFKLYRTGLHRRYRIFFAYLVFRIPYISFAIFMQGSSDQYYALFTWSEPIIMLFYILIVLEVYRLVLEGYKGLYTLGMWAMAAAVVIAVGVSVLSLRVAGAATQTRSFRMVFELRSEARLDLALVLFILLIIWFLSRYPISLNRNVVVHTVVYSLFFLANSLGLVFWFFGVAVKSAVNTSLMGIASACAIAWWIGLSKEGETVQVQLPSLGPGAEQRAMQQLKALNATLLKVSRQ